MRRIDPHSFVRATRLTTRHINRQIVLNLVREHQPISRADLARKMRLGRGRITQLVTELVRGGEIYVGRTTETPRGRRPEMLFVRTRDRLVMAIDIRFSRTFLMLGDFAGAPLALESFETMMDPTRLMNAIAKRVRAILRKHDRAKQCEGIGLVIPGMVDQSTGRVLSSPQLGWKDVDVRDALTKSAGLPVHIENAPTACALARMWLGEHGVSVPQNFVYVTVSDGVGAAVVVNGELVRGHSNTAGEFGHVPIDLNGPVCLCGARGCLEAYTSNIATLSRYLGVEFSAAPHNRLRSSKLTVLDVVERAKGGERRAIRALEKTGRYLGAGLAVIINALNPGMIFVGGEVTEAWEILDPLIRSAIRERALTASAASTPIVIEPADRYPRLRGATALVAARGFAAPKVA
jgi:predicted NBD/HSP70 family sugar kinase